MAHREFVGRLVSQSGVKLTPRQVEFVIERTDGWAGFEIWHFLRCRKVACCGSRRTRFGPA